MVRDYFIQVIYMCQYTDWNLGNR